MNVENFQIEFPADKWQSFYNIGIIISSLTMSNVIDEFFDVSNEDEVLKNFIPNTNQNCNLLGIE